MIRKLIYLPVLCIFANLSCMYSATPYFDVSAFFNKFDRTDKVVTIGALVAIPATYLLGKSLVNCITTTYDRNLIKFTKKALDDAHQEFDSGINLAKKASTITDYKTLTNVLRQSQEMMNKAIFGDAHRLLIGFGYYKDRINKTIDIINKQTVRLKERIKELENQPTHNKLLSDLNVLSGQCSSMLIELENLYKVFFLYEKAYDLNQHYESLKIKYATEMDLMETITLHQKLKEAVIDRAWVNSALKYNSHVPSSYHYKLYVSEVKTDYERLSIYLYALIDTLNSSTPRFAESVTEIKQFIKNLLKMFYFVSDDPIFWEEPKAYHS